MTNSYANGKIYKIISDKTECVYIGSTTQPLSKRFYFHKIDSSQKDKYKSKFYNIMREIGYENFRIILLKDFPCERREQLCAEEERCRKEIDNDILLNSHRCYITEEERKEHAKMWREKNKELLKKKGKIYYDENVELIRENARIYASDPKNKAKIKEKSKRYYNKHYDKLKENRKEKVECMCGSDVLKKDIRKHERSQKHIQYIENPTKIKEGITCECGSIVQRDNLTRHRKTLKHKEYIKNKELSKDSEDSE